MPGIEAILQHAFWDLLHTLIHTLILPYETGIHSKQQALMTNDNLITSSYLFPQPRERNQ